MSWNTCRHPECENWTYRPDVDYCESHRRANEKAKTNEKKSLEKRNSQIEKQRAKNQEPRQKPKKVSDKRAELNKKYFKLVEQFKKDNPHCKAKVNEYCTKRTDDVHHRSGRGRNLTNVSTWYPVCRSCHTYIEAHPKEAKERGWSESRLSVNQETPTI